MAPQSTSSLSSLLPPPPPVPNVKLSLPSPHVLLVTLDRPQALNAIPSSQNQSMAALWAWYDAQPQLRCAVLTGGDGRAFCAGADLREWNQQHHNNNNNNNNNTITAAKSEDNGNNNASQGQGQAQGQVAASVPPSWFREQWTADGFGGLSNRAGKKPVIAAVNGVCFGGGMEMVVNCDLVVADRARARFGLPEVRRGVVALAGALPRLVRTVGRQRAAEMALLGRMDYSAEQMRNWGVVNFVVPEGRAVEEAVRIAREIADDNSPDAVIASREGLRLGWEALSPQLGTEMLMKGVYSKINGGENMLEGLRSFVEKRKPVWKNSKL